MKHQAFLFAILALLVLAPARAEEPQADQAMLDIYSQIHTSLATDQAAGVADAAQQLATLAAKEKGETYEAIAKAATTLEGNDLAALRTEFKELSKAMATLLEAGAVQEAQLYYCPMSKAYWLQAKSDTIAKNPYYGSAMLKCGSKVEKLAG